jgi:exopolyphosphatase / guanosine-5'-triphosphate,3'-diphosphate pyrophosphatase
LVLEASVPSLQAGVRPPSRSAEGDATYAAIDLGTNNCRLLIARPNGRHFRIIDAFSRIVRLGEGLAGSGLLSEVAMTRAVDALKVCAHKVRRRAATHVRGVATEACRQAKNCEAFLARVRTETGLEIETISSAEEAVLAFKGCSPLLSARRPRAVVFDIGGGSTELGWLRLRSGRPPQILDTLSIPFGVVNLTERYGGSRIAPEVYDAMVAEVADNLRHFAEANGINQRVAAGAVQMLGTSGTVTTLAGVHLGLERYNRALIDGCYLDFPAIRAVSRQLAAMTCEERTASPCIGPERADLVVAGCAILEAICGLWPVGRLRVADRGVREGILAGLMQSNRGRHGRRAWHPQ